MLKMIWRKRVEENNQVIETPENWSWRSSGSCVHRTAGGKRAREKMQMILVSVSLLFNMMFVSETVLLYLSQHVWMNRRCDEVGTDSCKK